MKNFVGKCNKSQIDELSQKMSLIDVSIHGLLESQIVKIINHTDQVLTDEIL